MSGENEFSHPVKLDDIGAGETRYEISASAAARAALAGRFALLALDRLSAEITLSRTAEGILATCRLIALLEQACVATGEAVPASLDEPIELLFVAAPEEDGEVELDSSECDTMFHDGKVVDLGEAAAQTMGLALNPYPRSKAADETLRAAGVKSEEEAKAESGPFAALAALKAKN